MKVFLLGLAIVVSQANSQAESPTAIFTEFEKPAPEAVFAALRAELEAIMQPAGYRFEWRAVKTATGRDVFRELVVVNFKGHCEAPQAIGPREVAGPLGWTHTSGDDVLPFTDVHCDRVQNLLRNELRWDVQTDREKKLGRALARVLAHELYHVFARTKKHGSWGVAKSAYSAAELADKDFLFDDDDIDTLRARRTDAQGEVAEAEGAH